MPRLRHAASIAIAMLSAAAPAQTLYRFDGGLLFDGAFGPVARTQTRLAEELTACGSPVSPKVDGRFGARTRDALAALSRCPRFVAALANDPAARVGDLTMSFWEVLVGGAAPGVDERARTLMLSFEDTDYTRAEWNFCQSRPLYDPSAREPICYSNDPRSYMTWGPNGATAGNGREVQLILQALDRSGPALVDASFGVEAAAVRRTFVLPDGGAARTLETYLCGVWASPARRAAWREGFALLGRATEARATFDRLYASRALDGGKIATFYRLYAGRGLTPTEVDYAFFKDRAAHTTPDATAIDAAIGAALASGPASPWAVRRAIALRVRPKAQRVDRLGRDVAYYVDGAGLSALSAEELVAWRGRGVRRASEVGLSDKRPVANFTPGPAFPTAIDHPSALTAAETAACPAAVLATRRPAPKVLG